jgi:cytochrome P450
VRWTTPVIQFARTATRDYPLRGETIRKGQAVCLFYPSGNRDEEVFEDPFRFRIDRDPNRHIAFGMGEHVCLGAHLARLELRCAFGELRERLEHCEPAGPAERVRSSFVGGIKRAPMRWRLSPARR